MKTTLKNAIKLAQQIAAKYNQLSIEHEPFFNLYHDDLRIQMDCAWEEVNDIQYYLENKEESNAEIGMQNLKDTLAYVTYIIDVQNKLNNCPKSIYG